VIPTPDVSLNSTDAAEQAEMPQFLSGWLASGPARLAASLEEFAGHPGYGLDESRGDLERFVFLPGGSHGESPFGPQPGYLTRRQPGCRPVQASTRSSTACTGSGGTKPRSSSMIGCTTGCSRFSAKASKSSLDCQTST